MKRRKDYWQKLHLADGKNGYKNKKRRLKIAKFFCELRKMQLIAHLNN